MEKRSSEPYPLTKVSFPLLCSAAGAVNADIEEQRRLRSERVSAAIEVQSYGAEVANGGSV